MTFGTRDADRAARAGLLGPGSNDRPLANAFAIPGGRVYVFEGLMDTGNTPDPLAGVMAHGNAHGMAHEMGHIAIAMACGGGAAVIGVRTVLQSSYSRDAESATDADGARLTAPPPTKPKP